MENQYYLYEYKRQSPYIDKEEYLILTSELINLTTREKPIRLATFRSELEELYKLIAIVTLEEEETPEAVAIDLANNLNKRVSYNKKMYNPADYQTKVGREVAAHRIDNNSNRISSYNRSLQKEERKDERDNIQAKVTYHFLNDNIYNGKYQNNNKGKVANKKALAIAVGLDLTNDQESLLNKYRKLVLKRIVKEREDYFLAKTKAAAILINSLCEKYNLEQIKEVKVVRLRDVNGQINIMQMAKRNRKEFEKKLNELKDFNGANKSITYTYLDFKEYIELIKKLVAKELL